MAGVPGEANSSLVPYYRWRRKYGGLETSDVQRLKELTSENARLKRLLARAGSWRWMRLKELLAKNGKHGAAQRSSGQLPERAEAVGTS